MSRGRISVEDLRKLVTMASETGRASGNLLRDTPMPIELSVFRAPVRNRTYRLIVEEKQVIHLQTDDESWGDRLVHCLFRLSASESLSVFVLTSQAPNKDGYYYASVELGSEAFYKLLNATEDNILVAPTPFDANANILYESLMRAVARPSIAELLKWLDRNENKFSSRLFQTWRKVLSRDGFEQRVTTSDTGITTVPHADVKLSPSPTEAAYPTPPQKESAGSVDDGNHRFHTMEVIPRFIISLLTGRTRTTSEVKAHLDEILENLGLSISVKDLAYVIAFACTQGASEAALYLLKHAVEADPYNPFLNHAYASIILDARRKDLYPDARQCISRLIRLSDHVISNGKSSRAIGWNLWVRLAILEQLGDAADKIADEWERIEFEIFRVSPLQGLLGEYVPPYRPTKPQEYTFMGMESLAKLPPSQLDSAHPSSVAIEKFSDAESATTIESEMVQQYPSPTAAHSVQRSTRSKRVEELLLALYRAILSQNETLIRSILPQILDADITPVEATSVASMAQMARQVGLEDTALVLFEKALELDPNHEDILQAYVALIIDEKLIDRYERAEECLRRLLKDPIVPKDDYAFTLALAVQWAILKDEDYTEYLNQLLGEWMHSKEIGIFRRIAVALNKVKALDERLAVEEFCRMYRDAEDVFTKSADYQSLYLAHRSAADFLASMSNPEYERQAMDLYRKMCEGDIPIEEDDKPDILHNYATLLYKHDYDAEAGRVWCEAYKLNPNDANIRRGFASYLLRYGSPGLAQLVFEGGIFPQERLPKIPERQLPERFARRKPCETQTDQRNETGETPPEQGTAEQNDTDAE